MRWLLNGFLLLLCLTAIVLGSRDWLAGGRRPIKVVVPFAAGGESDTFARVIEKAIEDHGLLPEPLAIVNFGGAGGTIGSRHVKNARPDGYTVLLLHDAILTARYFGKVSYGPEAFEPVAGTMENGLLVVVAEGSDFEDLRDLLRAARDDPDEVVFGANLGAPTHLVGIQLQEAFPGARFRFTQAGGGAKRFAALAGGHITVTAFSAPEYLRFRTAGLRALAYLGEERHPDLPEVPTAREQGIPVFGTNLQMWWVPRGTPREKIDQLAVALERAMRTPEVRKFLQDMHSEPTFLTGEDLRARIRRREKEIAALPPPPAPGLPNFAVWAALATGVLGVGALVARKGQPIDDPGDAERGFHALRAWVCLGALVLYALVLSTGWVRFSLATAAFLFLTWGLTTSGSWRRLPAFALGSLAVGFGLHFLLTDVLFVDLP